MAFMSLIEDSDKELLKTFCNIFGDVTQKINILFKKVDQYVLTGDVDFLQDVSCHLQVNNRAAFTDITHSAVNNNIVIKQEKLSSIMVSNKDINKMPAPTIFPIQAVKRSTRTRRKPERYANELYTSSSSDVIIQNDTITTIDITDDKVDQVEWANKNMPTRSNRTKTIRKRSRSATDVESNKVKKLPEEQTKYIGTANATYVLMPQRDSLSANRTVADKNSESQLNRINPAATPKIEQQSNGAKASRNNKLEKENMQKYQEIEKKRALLQAKSEETRKKRELKQLKAHQLRLNMEQEKKVEMQKSKMAKFKLAASEKAHILRQQMEGTIQKINDKVKINKQAENVNNVVGGARDLSKPTKIVTRPDLAQLPVYMTEKMPLLPSNDCYDSDESVVIKPALPDRKKAESLRKTLLVMQVIDPSFINAFFSCTAQTPNLEEIFESIDPRKLIRTSSAVWKAVPRFTLLSFSKDLNFNQNWEDDAFSK